MIIVKLAGGLGNQLFQYALGRALAVRWSTELVLDATAFEGRDDSRRYSLGHFNIRAGQAGPRELRRVRRHRRGLGRVFSAATNLWRDIAEIREQRFAFDATVLEVGDDIYLEGYWQSEKYFRDVRPLLVEEVTLRRELSRDNAGFARQIETTENAVSLHIRRGDYVTDPKVRSIHDVCTLDYYRRCVDAVCRRISHPHLFVFSDDIPWARGNLSTRWPTTFVENEGDTRDYEELMLMSRCAHHIIANSSFSWWAAWLNDSSEKAVFAPDRWFRPGTLDAPDICPIDWERIATDPIRAVT